ncbi:MAG: GIY-YIG nuclease family protein [Rickettsiales bacterium]
MKNPCVYMMSSRKDGVIYIGVTSDLVKRVYEHKNRITKGFVSQYNVFNLVYFELHETMESAIMRESQVKAWKRAWKIELIEKENPEWNDLYASRAYAVVRFQLALE